MLTGTDCAGKRNKPRAAGIRLQRRAGDLAAGRVRLQQQVPPRAGTGKGGGGDKTDQAPSWHSQRSQHWGKVSGWRDRWAARCCRQSWSNAVNPPKTCRVRGSKRAITTSPLLPFCLSAFALCLSPFSSCGTSHPFLVSCTDRCMAQHPMAHQIAHHSYAASLGGHPRAPSHPISVVPALPGAIISFPGHGTA